MDRFSITLSKPELDVIMKALGELPLKESLPVFNSINEQFVAQTQPKTEE